MLSSDHLCIHLVNGRMYRASMNSVKATRSCLFHTLAYPSLQVLVTHHGMPLTPTRTCILRSYACEFVTCSTKHVHAHDGFLALYILDEGKQLRIRHHTSMWQAAIILFRSQQGKHVNSTTNAMIDAQSITHARTHARTQNTHTHTFKHINMFEYACAHD
jgi:hypothetical protein